MDKGRVVMGLLFYPRGGSAYVVRYLSPALARAGWSVSLAVGSLGAAGDETHAPTFFDGLDVHFVDSTDAVRAFESGDDAIAAPLPMHPSYEDRADVPDVVFASVPPELAEHLSAVWEGPLRAAGADDAEVFHLHHLTPQLDAVRRHWPQVPLVVHLHGTEMKMIDAIEERAALAARVGESLETMPEAVPDLALGADELDAPQIELLRETRWASWRHGAFWAARMKEQVQWADHLITVSPQNRETAISMFGLDPGHVTALPNGVDIERFRPRPPTPGARRDTFRRALVDDPQGWTRNGPTRSARVHRSRPRPPARCRRRRDGAALRRTVPRVQARARARARVRPGAGPVHATGFPRDLGWPSRRVGRRASRDGGRGRRFRWHLLHRLARSRRPSGRAGRVRRARGAVRRRPVPPGAARGDGRRVCRCSRAAAAVCCRW